MLTYDLSIRKMNGITIQIKQKNKYFKKCLRSRNINVFDVCLSTMQDCIKQCFKNLTRD